MTLGEQRRKALELLAPPPSRHDHSDGGIPRQSAARPDRSREQRFSRGTPQNQPFDLFTGR